MVHQPERRVLRFLAAAAVVLGLLLLLLPHSAAFHSDIAACFVLLPVLLFGIVESSDPALPAKESLLDFYRAPIRSALFQRPPPPAIA
jgi:hypothetical protein